MSARLVWIATCEVCETTEEFDGSLTVEALGDAARDADWDLPIWGGMLCRRCAHTVKALSRADWSHKNLHGTRNMVRLEGDTRCGSIDWDCRCIHDHNHNGLHRCEHGGSWTR